jgi:LacI family transcriptional regulator
MEHPLCTSVIIDNVGAGFEATSHLIQQGCQRIMHVTGNLKRNVYSGRALGYKNAIEKAGLQVDESLIMVTDLSQEAGTEAAMRVHQMKQRPDGIFIANDICAVSCMRSLKEKGYVIPEDIAIVGFNNDPVSEVIEPNLTTIFYPGQQMGSMAVKTMIGQLNGSSDFTASRSIVLQSELLVRKSSLKRPGN